MLTLLEMNRDTDLRQVISPGESNLLSKFRGSIALRLVWIDQFSIDRTKVITIAVLCWVHQERRGSNGRREAKTFQVPQKHVSKVTEAGVDAVYCGDTSG